MIGDSHSLHEVLADQFRLVTELLCSRTGEYHRLLQRVAAAGFLRQLAENGSPADLAEAERCEIAATLAAEFCEQQLIELERRLGALGRELAALR